MKDDGAFKTAIVTNLEMQMDPAGERQMEDLEKMISSASQAMPHERRGMSGQMQKCESTSRQ